MTQPASSQGSLAAHPIGWVERGLVPDPLIRAGIRRLCEQRLAEIGADDAEHAARLGAQFVQQMSSAPVGPPEGPLRHRRWRAGL